jgi:hypothetical protein
MRFRRYVVLATVGVVLWFIVPPRAAEVWEVPYSSGSGAKARVVRIGGAAFIRVGDDESKGKEEGPKDGKSKEVKAGEAKGMESGQVGPILRRMEEPPAGKPRPDAVEYVTWSPRIWRDDTGSPARPEVRLWRVALFLFCVGAAAVALFAIISDAPPVGAAVGLLAGLATAMLLLGGCTLICDRLSQAGFRGDSPLRLNSEAAWDWFFHSEFLTLTLGASLGAARGIIRSGAVARQRAYPRMAFGLGLIVALVAACWGDGYRTAAAVPARDERDRLIDGQVARRIDDLPKSHLLLVVKGGAGEDDTGLIGTNPASPDRWLKSLVDYGGQLTSCCAELKSVADAYAPSALRPDGVAGPVVAATLTFPRPREDESGRPSRVVGPPWPPVEPGPGSIEKYYAVREQYATTRRGFDGLLDRLRSQLAAADRLLADWPSGAALDEPRRALAEFARYTHGLPEAFYRRDAVDELSAFGPRDFGQSFLDGGEAASQPLAACLMVEDANDLAGRYEAAVGRTRGNAVEFLRLRRERVALLMTLLPLDKLGDLSLMIFNGSRSDTMRRRFDRAVRTLGPDGLSPELVEAWGDCNQAHQKFADKLVDLRRENLRRLGLPGLEPVHQRAMMRLEGLFKELFVEAEKKPSEDDLYPTPKVQPGPVGPQWTPEEAKREAVEALALSKKWERIPAKFDVSLGRSVTEEIGLKMDEKLQKILRIDPVKKTFDAKYTYKPHGITKDKAVEALKVVAVNEMAEFFKGLARDFGANKAAAQPMENWLKDDSPQKANRQKVRGFLAEPENEKYQAKERDIRAASWANETAKDGRPKLATDAVDFVPSKDSKPEDRKKAHDELMTHADRFLACINQVASSFKGSPKDPGEDLTRELGLWWSLFYSGEGENGIPNPGDALDESRQAAKGELSAESFADQSKQVQEDSPPEFKGDWPKTRPEQLKVLQQFRDWGMKLDDALVLVRNLPGAGNLARELYGLDNDARDPKGNAPDRRGDPRKEP